MKLLTMSLQCRSLSLSTPREYTSQVEILPRDISSLIQLTSLKLSVPSLVRSQVFSLPCLRTVEISVHSISLLQFGLSASGQREPTHLTRLSVKGSPGCRSVPEVRSPCPVLPEELWVKSLSGTHKSRATDTATCHPKLCLRESLVLAGGQHLQEGT